jgi:predicted acylesterase/phospholipase RssA
MSATGATFLGTNEFKDVLDSETRSINKRRNALGLKPVSELPGAQKGSAPLLDTVGLALSGGGIRSAAFCMGALQAIEIVGALKRIDYLSTVSGGGYIGSSLTASLNAHKTTDKDKDKPPIFASPISGSESPGVQHIRDYSNYLIPHGSFDVLQSAGIYLRGLAANFLLVFPWLLFSAAVTIFLKPKRELLLASSFQGSIYLALALLVLLVIWALARSVKARENEPEVPSFLTWLFGWYLVIVFISLFCESQPFVIEALFKFTEANATVGNADSLPVGPFLIGMLNRLAAVLAPIAAIVGFLGSKLGYLIKRAAETSEFRAQALGLISKFVIYVAALAVPLLLWVVYLDLCYWGIDRSNAGTANYGAPEWVRYLSQWVVSFVAPVIKSMLLWLVNPSSWSIRFYNYAITAPIALLYLASWIALFFVSAFLSANGNSLHRLYRDRLSKAFLFKPKDQLKSGDEEIDTIDHVRLSTLSEEDSPYHLINTALNIQDSKIANRRGRNADFFLFSRNYIGSATTGYVRTADMEAKAPEVDLATAMAVSGAAVSSNMGSETIKPWTLTLAMLNVRLGFWLCNPRYIRVRLWLLRLFHYLFNPYFLYEIFGLLNENRWYVYLTDGGHVENLGMYELLRRRCQLIIAVDAEADPGMNFNSFIRLQRYARIDLGVRIEVPWREISLVSLDTGRVIAEKGDASSAISREGPHCAVGTIYYPGGVGYLLYVKASLSGDESDYVVDYKRRNGSFPHETTGDQFFSEEQFEVYRNLGFHVLSGVFSGRDDVAAIAVMQRGKGSSTAKATQAKTATRQVHPILKNIRKILDFSAPDVLPTVMFTLPKELSEADK